MTPGARLWWLVALTLGLSACGSCHPGDSGQSSESGPGPAQACQDFAEAYCGRLNACAPFLMQVSYGDVATCAARAQLTCGPGLSAPGAHATATDMESCARAMEVQSCDDALDNSQPSACMVPGERPEGATCGVGTQCQSGYCRSIPGTICGKCAPHSAAGGPCFLDGDCAATLVCNQNVCAGPGGPGNPCGPSQPCLRSLACVAGTCRTPVAVGSPCTFPGDCDGTHGAYCDLVRHECRPTRVASTGDACGLIDGGVVACIRGESCASAKDGQGACHATASDRAPCGPDITCMPPATCTLAARCTLPNPAACQ
jgi:hypothetical protein